MEINEFSYIPRQFLTGVVFPALTQGDSKGYASVQFRCTKTGRSSDVSVSVDSIEAVLGAYFQGKYANQIKMLEAVIEAGRNLNDSKAQQINDLWVRVREYGDINTRATNQIKDLEQVAAKRLDEIQGLKNQLKASQEQVAELRLAPAKERDLCSDLLNKKDAEIKRMDKVIHGTRDALLSYATEAKKANGRVATRENEVANWKESYSKLSAECRRLEEVCKSHYDRYTKAELAGINEKEAKETAEQKLKEASDEIARLKSLSGFYHTGSMVSINGGQSVAIRDLAGGVMADPALTRRIDKIKDRVDIVEKAVEALRKPTTVVPDIKYPMSSIPLTDLHGGKLVWLFMGNEWVQGGQYKTAKDRVLYSTKVVGGKTWTWDQDNQPIYWKPIMEEGYELVDPRETIKLGDEYLNTNGKWHLSRCVGTAQQTDTPYRRKIK